MVLNHLEESNIRAKLDALEEELERIDEDSGKSKRAKKSGGKKGSTREEKVDGEDPIILDFDDSPSLVRDKEEEDADFVDSHHEDTEDSGGEVEEVLKAPVNKSQTKVHRESAARGRKYDAKSEFLVLHQVGGVGNRNKHKKHEEKAAKDNVDADDLEDNEGVATTESGSSVTDSESELDEDEETDQNVREFQSFLKKESQKAASAGSISERIKTLEWRSRKHGGENETDGSSSISSSSSSSNGNIETDADSLKKEGNNDPDLEWKHFVRGEHEKAFKKSADAEEKPKSEFMLAREKVYRESLDQIRRTCDRYQSSYRDLSIYNKKQINKKSLVVDLNHGLAYCRHGKVRSRAEWHFEI